MRGAAPVSAPGHQASSWKRELRESIRDVRLLEDLLPGIADGPWTDRYRRACERALDIEKRFPFAVTSYYLALARPGDPACPILGQILPDPAELQDITFPLEDPLAEESHMPVPGLTHRYPDRALWYLTHHCPVYCRFCMRRRKVSYAGTGPTSEEIRGAIDYIAGRSRITEVILSGGDPLSLSDEALERILVGLRRIPHLASIRIHTRMPVTLPSRITPEFSRLVERLEPLTIVTHFNHEREITAPAVEAVRRLRRAGALVLNQSVLLRGVNDTAEALSDLFLGLVRAGVKPYYLHQCDEVRGTSRFRVDIVTGMRLMKEMRGNLPGMALPLYVLDLPGGGGKVPVDGSWMIRAEDAKGGYLFENSEGRRFELARFRERSSYHETSE